MLLNFIMILLAVALYGFLHSWLASVTVKAALRRRFGAGVDRWYRVAYVVFVTFTFFPLPVLVEFLRDRRLYFIPFPWLIFTSAVQIAAIGLLVVGLLQTGVWRFIGLRQILQEERQSGDDHPKATRLVTGGLYRYVRHPLYTAALIFLWLTPVMTLNLLALNLGLTGYILVGIIFEERKLVIEFGEEYLQYRRRTPALIPAFPRLKN